MDMRAGTDTALASVVAVFSAAQPHTAYIFANKRTNRLKVLVHDGFGIWLAARLRISAIVDACFSLIVDGQGMRASEGLTHCPQLTGHKASQT